MTIILEIYIIVCILLLLFDLGFLIVKNTKNKQIQSKDTSFQAALRREIEAYPEKGAFSEGFMQTLPKKLSKTAHLVSLNSIWREYPEAKNWFRLSLFAQIENYRKKPEYVQAFYTYMIAELDYSEEKVPTAFSSSFMTFLESKSLYTFTNTMDAIYTFGEPQLLLQALEQIDKRPGFYHQKLLVDGLLRFRGDFDLLNQALLSRFAQYGEFVQECLLDYFRMQGCDASALCLQLMREETAEPEIQYRVMRYFQKFPCEEAKNWFLQILQRENVIWVKQLLAIQGLERYEDAAVWAVMKEKVTSRDWYVRNSAIAFLHKKGMQRQELAELLSLNDKYANESLLYQYKDDKETSAFIRDTMQQLEQQAAQTV